MKLHYDYSAKKRKILIELETREFTAQEVRALDVLGEPLVSFQKTYPGGCSVAINKKLRSEFKIRVRFDGTDNFELANEAAQQFLKDIHEYLVDLMEKLMDQYEDQMFPPKHGIIEISNFN